MFLTVLFSACFGVLTLTAGTNSWESAMTFAGASSATDCSGSNVVAEPTEAALRTAIAKGGFVRICCDGTIRLSQTIDIAQDVSLDGTGRNVVISGNNAVRLFDVRSNVNFAATNVILANGRHVGATGAPGAAGQPGEGGAIRNLGTVTLVSSAVTGNQAVGGNGGATDSQGIGGAGQAGRGGAIFNQDGTVFLKSVILLNNSAIGGEGGLGGGSLLNGKSGDAYGGAIYNLTGSVVLADCALGNNFSAGPATNRLEYGHAWGGALFHASGFLIVSNCQFQGNAVRGSHSTFTQLNQPRPGSAYGGAIAALEGTVHLENATFDSNIVQGGNAFRQSGAGEASGGAVFSKAVLTVRRSSFSQNRVLPGGGSSRNPDGTGGALYSAGAANLTGCVFYLNHAQGGSGGNFAGFLWPGGNGFGGALYNTSALSATNCTFALNNAQGGGSVGIPTIPGNGLGGGLFNAGGSVTGINITVASNTVMPGISFQLRGNAAGANIGDTNGTVRLRNSLLAYAGTNSNVVGAILDEGFNISSDASAQFSSGTSFNSTDPQLGPLTDNGGPTLTLALLPSSPAIDSGGRDAAPPEDQRGFVRPFGAGIDIGAYELHRPEPPRLSISRESSQIILTFDGRANQGYRLESCAADFQWQLVEEIPPRAEAMPIRRTFGIANRTAQFYRVMAM